MSDERKPKIVIALKVVVVFVLSIVLIVVVVSSAKCDFSLRTDRHGFFADSELKELSDMPKIRSKKPTKMEYGTFYFTTTQEEFNRYVCDFYDYILSKPYKFLCTPKKAMDNFFGAITSVEVKPCSCLEDFTTYYLENGYINGDSNRYFFVLGEDLAERKEDDTSSYTKVLGRYIKMCYVSGGMVVDKETGFEWNAYIELPYSLIDYTFYLYTGKPDGTLQENATNSELSYNNRINEQTSTLNLTGILNGGICANNVSLAVARSTLLQKPTIKERISNPLCILQSIRHIC